MCMAVELYRAADNPNEFYECTPLAAEESPMNLMRPVKNVWKQKRYDFSGARVLIIVPLPVAMHLVVTDQYVNHNKKRCADVLRQTVQLNAPGEILFALSESDAVPSPLIVRHKQFKSGAKDAIYPFADDVIFGSLEARTATKRGCRCLLQDGSPAQQPCSTGCPSGNGCYHGACCPLICPVGQVSVPHHWTVAELAWNARMEPVARYLRVSITLSQSEDALLDVQIAAHLVTHV
ncbi:hypothetical protein KIN20_016106 [Parelaphostrongylus tenuis]|uniref:Uncharacterized protein n=1 Tax=Parelaphostrongylus tenuis TaxID=148309 RepID=A0AAD5QQG2_PARTN|nr:hypothetical protein KIN20_016106 [Parelaphostrongylus tenuis]